MKYCIDCKYFKPYYWGFGFGYIEFGKCMHSSAIRDSLSRADKMLSPRLINKKEQNYASIERGSVFPEKCGEKARYWEPKR